MKKWVLWLLLAALLFSLCGCKQNPTEEALFAKLIAHLQERGYTCTLSRLADTQPGREVPIYNASVWHRLTANGEELLVYFDESNRADYLSASIDQTVYGQVACYGLRFIVLYDGDDPGLKAALAEMPG